MKSGLEQKFEDLKRSFGEKKIFFLTLSLLWLLLMYPMGLELIK